MAFYSSMPARLMLIHGMVDENVHFRHTARLVNALVSSRKPYDLVLFPDERHAPQRVEDRVYMESRMFTFLKEHLRATV